MDTRKTQVTICGGGNLAHFSACIIGSKPNFTVNVFTRRPKEWNKTLTATPIKDCPWANRGIIEGKINLASDDPKEVCKNSEIFIVCGPAHIHQTLLEKIAPFVQKNAYIGTVYGQGGFDMCANYVFGKRIQNDNLTLFSFQTVPSITQIEKYGNSLRIIGPKNVLYVTSSPTDRVHEMCKITEKLYGIVAVPVPNFLNMTLVPSNQIIHPARVYGIFKDWDGKSPYKREDIPMLYEGIDEFSADLMSVLDNEIQQIKYGILKRYPSTDLSFVIPMKQRIINQYGDQITDKTSMWSVFKTNNGYKTVKVPVVEIEGGVILNLKGRFFTEDIPYGLCVLKGIASMVDVTTPGIDKLIYFHQQFMGKEFIIDGKLNPAMIPETGAPQRYGINTIEQLLHVSNFKAKL